MTSANSGARIPPFTVLLVEDNPGDARLVHEHFRQAIAERWMVIAVDRLRPALERARGGGIDVILLDLGLPDASGLEALRAIREVAPRVPIVVLTGLHDRAIGITAVREGAQDYLVKGELYGPLLLRSVRYAVERQRMVVALERSLEAVQVAERAKRMFLANVSHELRTPLNVIFGMAELALDRDIGAEVRSCLETIRSAGYALLFSIENILDFCQLEGNQLALDLHDFDVRETVHEAVQLLRRRAEEKRLTLTCEVAATVPETVVGDGRRVRQVLCKLLDNAVKFTDVGSVGVRVGVDEQSEDAIVLRYEVADTGIGVPPEKQDAIFQPFTQADGSTTRRHGGAGLGLTVAAELVRAMGGTVRVQSMPGAGSTFGFTTRLARVRRPPVSAGRLASRPPLSAGARPAVRPA